MTREVSEVRSGYKLPPPHCTPGPLRLRVPATDQELGVGRPERGNGGELGRPDNATLLKYRVVCDLV